MTELRKEIEHAINRCSGENASNTPDFILAQFLSACLDAFDTFDTGIRRREEWYGRDPYRGPGHGDSRLLERVESKQLEKGSE